MKREKIKVTLASGLPDATLKLPAANMSEAEIGKFLDKKYTRTGWVMWIFTKK